MKIAHIMNRAANIFRKGPIAVSKVDGFSIAVEKKDGVLLTNKNNGQKTPASEPSYYEVTINVDGSNPEYPANDKPYKMAFTTALSKAVGMAGNVAFVPAGHSWHRFELKEIFDESKRPTMGKWMPAHHRVELTAHYQDAQKNITTMSMSAWVRKSDREKPSWERALRGPTWM